MTTNTLYRAYDKAGQLLYVGVSCRGIRRFDEHAKRPWWQTVAAIKVEHFHDRKAAFDAESLAITAEAPVHNRAGVPTRTCGVPTRAGLGLPCRHLTDGGPCVDHGGKSRFELLRPVRQGGAS